MKHVHNFVSMYVARIYMYVNIHTLTHAQTYLSILKCVKIVEYRAKPLNMMNVILFQNRTS